MKLKLDVLYRTNEEPNLHERWLNIHVLAAIIINSLIKAKSFESGPPAMARVGSNGPITK